MTDVTTGSTGAEAGAWASADNGMPRNRTSTTSGRINAEMRVPITHHPVNAWTQGLRRTLPGRAEQTAERKDRTYCDHRVAARRFPGAAVAAAGTAERRPLVTGRCRRGVAGRFLRPLCQGLGTVQLVSILLSREQTSFPWSTQ